MLLVAAYALQKDKVPYNKPALNALEAMSTMASVYALLGGTLFYQSEFDEIGTNVLGVFVLLIIISTGLVIFFVILLNFQAIARLKKSTFSTSGKKIDRLAISWTHLAKDNPAISILLMIIQSIRGTIDYLIDKDAKKEEKKEKKLDTLRTNCSVETIHIEENATISNVSTIRSAPALKNSKK